MMAASAAQQYVPSICPAAPEPGWNKQPTDRPKQSLTLKLNHGSVCCVEPERRLVKPEHQTEERRF